MPIFAQAAGAKLAYVAEEAASPAAQAIVVPQSSTIKTIAELKGKKIAVTKGAGSHYLLLAALAKSGLSFKDITPAYLTPADGRAAFVSNNVDAWVAWDPFLTSALHQTKGTDLIGRQQRPCELQALLSRLGRLCGQACRSPQRDLRKALGDRKMGEGPAERRGRVARGPLGD